MRLVRPLLSLLLLAALAPARAAQREAPVGLPVAPLTLAAPAAPKLAQPALSPSLPALPAALPPSAPAVTLSAPAASAAQASQASIAATESETAVVRVPDVAAALAELREASYPRHDDTDALIRTLAARHPELPLSPDLVFLVKDAAALERFGLPEQAAGAARILSDGRTEAKVVLIVAPRGVGLDDFVEYAVHEAVHLRDDGILRLPHGRLLEHWLAEGYTQLRSHRMANESLRALGRPERPNPAYSREVALVEALIARRGEAALLELVERGSVGGLKAALGPAWDELLALSAKDPRATLRYRKEFLDHARAMVERL